MQRKPAFILALGLFVAGGCSRAPRHAADSQVASFTLDELKTKDGAPVWDSVAVKMLRFKPSSGEITRSFKRKDFGGGQLGDLSILVEYGTYTIALDYSDATSKLVYRVCAAEKNAEYEINQPEFHAPIAICRVTPQGEEQAGQVEIKPSSAVKLNPVLDDAGGALSANPFTGVRMYVNPAYAAQVEKSVARESGDIATKMNKLKGISTAFWIDSIAKIQGFASFLAEANADQSRSGQSNLITFVVYDLPERDCAASASAGELAGENGLRRYKSEYIDAIASLMKKYNKLHFAAIIEPDSLPNLATNMSVSKCHQAAPLYREGVAYAIEKLSLPHAALYLDAAHGGWLGWESNRKKMAGIFAEVLQLAGGSEKIRGFATNVANYSPLQVAVPDLNPNSYYQDNPTRDEKTFAQEFRKDLAAAGIKNHYFIIDTSRNGQPHARSKWGNWCNIAAAGLGERPRVQPAEGIDAYVWIKPPGESDGVSNTQAARYDQTCSSSDSLNGAPQAGEWFHEHFKAMVQRALPAL